MWRYGLKTTRNWIIIDFKKIEIFQLIVDFFAKSDFSSRIFLGVSFASPASSLWLKQTLLKSEGEQFW